MAWERHGIARQGEAGHMPRYFNQSRVLAALEREAPGWLAHCVATPLAYTPCNTGVAYSCFRQPAWCVLCIVKWHCFVCVCICTYIYIYILRINKQQRSDLFGSFYYYFTLIVEKQARNASLVACSQVTDISVVGCISGIDPASPCVMQQKAGTQIECPLHIGRRIYSPTYVCNWLPVRANARTCSQLVGSGLLVPPTIFRTPSGCSASKMQALGLLHFWHAADQAFLFPG